MKKKWTTFWEGASFKLKAGLILSILMLLLALIGQFWTPYSPTAMDASAVMMAPGPSHWFGTDNYGRDVLSRVMNGCGVTYLVAFSTVLIGAAAGTVIGALTGYFGGIADEIIMRVNDIILSFPSVLLALIFISLLGKGTYNIILALGLLFIPSFTRIVRSEMIRYKERDFVQSARIMKISPMRIVFRHLLPNARTSLLTSAAIGFNNAVLAEASMSYLGLGVQPPTPSLGRMLNEAQGYLFNAPWYAIFPGITIILIILGFSLLSDGLKNSRSS